MEDLGFVLGNESFSGIVWGVDVVFTPAEPGVDARLVVDKGGDDWDAVRRGMTLGYELGAMLCKSGCVADEFPSGDGRYVYAWRRRDV